MPWFACLSQCFDRLEPRLVLFTVSRLRLPLLDYLLVNHHYKSSFRGLLAEFRAVSEKHRYLVRLDHAVREEKLVTMHGLSLFIIHCLSPLVHICKAY